MEARQTITVVRDAVRLFMSPVLLSSGIDVDRRKSFAQCAMVPALPRSLRLAVPAIRRS
jgi:hypothetical protein